VQFTEKFIQALKARAERYDIREQSGEGFAIRVSPSGEKSWVFIYAFEGRKRRMTLGSYPNLSLLEARKKHREALKVLEKGFDPGFEKQKKKIEACLSSTVNDLISEYIEKWAKPRKRSWEGDQRILNKDIKPSLGKRKAKDITRRDVILLLDRIKERGAPIQANRTLACVRRMFNFAVERDIIPISPCVSVKAVAKENRKDRCLTVDEIKKFWAELSGCRKLGSGKFAIQMSGGCRFALRFQLVTGQRKGEVVSAEWSEIDLVSGWWVIPAEKAKNGQSHRVPLSSLAMELLEEIKALSAGSPWAFPSEKTDGCMTGAAIDHAMRRSTFVDEINDGEIKEMKRFTPHDLRRTAATHMTSMGISRLVVSKLLNHVENSVTAIYDRHSYDSEKKLALEAWANKLRQMIGQAEVIDNVIELQKAV
jgi:integrase